MFTRPGILGLIKNDDFMGIMNVLVVGKSSPNSAVYGAEGETFSFVVISDTLW